jgi:hypothetical protein
MQQQRPVYDVCIVGSGAGGGMAAYALTKAGASVVMLEAGPAWYATEDSPMLMWNWQSPRRGASTPIRPFGEFDACDGGWQVEGEPYTTGPGTRFNWWRARMLGGRTNHWGRISLRFGPDDFRRKSLDGLGDDWPITYDDVKPYYDEVDKLVGIFGSQENLHNEPDGIFHPPPKPRCYELMVKQASDKLKITCIPARLSIITKPLGERAACHYCGQCNRGCSTNSNFSSPSVLIAPAMKTGKLRLITNAMAREVTIDAQGRATGVSYINKRTNLDEHVRARIVVLAASAFESARLLLNSKSAMFPQGLANSSGTTGKYVTDTTGSDVSGFIPKLMNHVPHNEDGVGGMHVYMPWWLDNKKLDFPRGYHIEVWGGRRGMPGYGFMGGIHRYPPGGGYGKALKDDYRRYWGATIGFSGRGEMIPNDDSYCEIDPTMVDRWGGYSRAALPLEMDGSRVEPGEAHAGNFPCARRRDGRHGVQRDADSPAGVRHRRRRYDHSRAGRRAHGQRSAHFRNQQVDADTRRAESLPHRWCAVRFAGGQESNLDYSGAVAAHQRTHRRADEAEGFMSEQLPVLQTDDNDNRSDSDIGSDNDNGISRREVVAFLGIAPLAAALGVPPETVEGAMRVAQQAAAQQQRQQQGPQQQPAPGVYKPRFFTPHEWRTVRVLADLVIPRDERSGSATDAGVPEFMDFMMIDRPNMQLGMRGGLRWLDNHSNMRFNKRFVELTSAQQTSILDEIAFPARAKPDVSHGVSFFTSFRDLTAGGFWSSRIGVRDIGYVGNEFTQWNGCPPAALQRLGVSEDAMNTRIPFQR